MGKLNKLKQNRSKSYKKITLRTDMPCPCGSGKAIAVCHLDIDGRFRKLRPSLHPPGTKAGFSHARCYLRGTCDCSEQISREHYISRSVLEQLGAILRVSGAAWLNPGETLDAMINSLAANILCTRHNAALSPLDTEAGYFFNVLTKALDDLNRKTLSRRPIFHLVNGDALELWMLKVACGLYFSIGTKDREKVAKTHSIDLEKVQRGFFEGRWDEQGGLYFRGAIGSRITVGNQVGLGPLLMDHTLRFGGAVVSLRGFTLQLIFDTRDQTRGPWAGLVKRPSELVLKKRPRQHHIILTWPFGTPEASVMMEETRAAVKA
jgi:hypothetical protein